MRDLRDGDVIPLAFATLRADVNLTTELGGGVISGEREAPWPCLVVSGGADQLGTGLSVQTGAVSLQLYDSFDVATGPHQCRRILRAAAAALRALRDADYSGSGPIVTEVTFPGSLTESNTTAGQARYNLEVSVGVLPPA